MQLDRTRRIDVFENSTQYVYALSPLALLEREGLVFDSGEELGVPKPLASIVKARPRTLPALFKTSASVSIMSGKLHHQTNAKAAIKQEKPPFLIMAGADRKRKVRPSCFRCSVVLPLSVLNNATAVQGASEVEIYRGRWGSAPFFCVHRPLR